MRLTLQQMLKFGLEFGHNKKNTIFLSGWIFFSWRKKFFLIDLLKTFFFFKQGLYFLRESVLKREPILFVTLLRPLSYFLARYAALCGENFVVFRWVSGMLTNSVSLTGWDKVLFKVLKEGYKLQQKEKKRISSFFGLTSKMYRRTVGFGIVPKIIGSEIVIEEFKSANIPVLSLIDSNVNSHGLLTPVPGNDDSFVSLNFFLYFSTYIILSYKVILILKWLPYYWRQFKMAYYQKLQDIFENKVTNYKWKLMKRELKLPMKRKKLNNFFQRKKLIYFFLKNRNLSKFFKFSKDSNVLLNKKTNLKRKQQTDNIFYGLNEVFVISEFFKNVST